MTDAQEIYQINKMTDLLIGESTRSEINKKIREIAAKRKFPDFQHSMFLAEIVYWVVYFTKRTLRGKVTDPLPDPQEEHIQAPLI